MHRSFLTAFIALGFLFSATPAQGKKTLAVLPLTGVGVEQRITVLLTDLLTVRVSELGTYEVLATDEINAMIGMEKVKEVAGCDNVACAAQIAGMLGVDEMVTGNVGRLGDNLNLKLTLFDSVAMKVLKRSLKIVKNDENLFEGVVLEALSDLFGSTLWQAKIAELKAAAVASPASTQAAPQATSADAVSASSDAVIRSSTSPDVMGICQKGEIWWFCQGDRDIFEGQFAAMYVQRMGTPNPVEKYDSLRSGFGVAMSSIIAGAGVAFTIMGAIFVSTGEVGTSRRSVGGQSLGAGVGMLLFGVMMDIMCLTAWRYGIDPVNGDHEMKLDEARFYVEQYNNKDKAPPAKDAPSADVSQRAMSTPHPDSGVKVQLAFFGTGFGLVGTF